MLVKDKKVKKIPFCNKSLTLKTDNSEDLMNNLQEGLGA